ncbi:lateral flagellar M-ring protein (FliF-like) [Escherichia coli]|uniref:Lateral flagellar M-ring protein (FliF-like) n=1 Tax=Escherichia coli TaxID=562 RepID=A0A376K2M0_ECOLX|nr:lateral flagellar M-ring protein (FliF-like) [Escherichia coli]
MNAQIKKLTQAFPAFRLRLADNKRWALMAGVGLAVAATAIIVSVLWTGNRGYVSLYGRQENLPVVADCHRAGRRKAQLSHRPAERADTGAGR